MQCVSVVHIEYGTHKHKENPLGLHITYPMLITAFT